MPIYGTNSIDDLLATENQSVLEFGMDRVAEVIQADLETWNRLWADAVSYLASPTTDHAARYGVSNDFDMYRGDEFDRGVAQKGKGGYEVGFPLEPYHVNVGWTTKALKVRSVADITRQYTGVRQGHRRRLYRELQRAFYRPTNRTVTDDLIDGKELTVRALLNADSTSIPNGPYGDSFDGSTHTHYDATASLTDANLRATLADVREHSEESNLVILINENDLTTVSALDGFTAAAAPTVIVGANVETTVERLDTSRSNNRFVGVYDGYRVETRPWALPSYILVIDQDGERPLRLRQRAGAALQGLQMRSSTTIEPLLVDFFEAEFGFGAWRRDAAAVLYFGVSGTYAAPSITSDKVA